MKLAVQKIIADYFYMYWKLYYAVLQNMQMICIYIYKRLTFFY